MFIKSKALSFCLLFCLSSAVSFSQTCGGIIENFNNTAGTTAGYTGNLSLATTGSNGYLQKASVIGSAVYSVTTPTFQLGAAATNLGYGFLLGGTRQVARIEVSVIFTSTLNNEVTSFFLGQFIPSYDNTTPPTAGFCRTVDLTDLPGFAPGSRYRFRIDLSPGLAFGGATETITFDDFRTNGTNSLIPLPVNFMSFDAKKAAGGVQLTWKVGGEENVSRYEVERSADGRSFSTIASMGKLGFDTYSYTDATLAGSAVYYRIKNVDMDGKFKYSTIARFKNGVSEIVLKAFPSPVQSKLTLQHPIVTGNGLVTISTADGRVVKSVKPATGSMQTYIDMSSLQAGIYMVRIDAGEGATETIKIVKQ